MLQDVSVYMRRGQKHGILFLLFYDVFASRAQQKIVKQWLKNGPKSTSESIL